MIKIVTGIRRSGKSYLLRVLFKNYLIDNGIKEDHIIELDFENRRNKKYRDPDALLEYPTGKHYFYMEIPINTVFTS